MGESAKINTDLHTIENIKDPNLIDSLDICSKAKQVKKYEIVYNKVDNYSSSSGLKGVNTTATPAFKDYFNDQITNDPLAVIAYSYGIFINRLEFSDIIPKRTKFYLKTSEAKKILLAQGYTFSKKENEFLEKYIKIEALENSPKQKKFKTKYQEEMKLFSKKYSDSIPELYKYFPEYSLVEKNLIEKKILVTKNEKKLLKAYLAQDKNKITKEIKQFYIANIDSIRKFNLSYQPLLYAKEDADIRNLTLLQILNIRIDIAADIMLARSYCQNFIRDFRPVNNKDLAIIKKQFKNPFVAEYVGLINQQVIEQIIVNKQKSITSINKVPQTKADFLFDSIMKKYKGKIVYVDFWATWCGPCRSGIEQMKPLKEEMTGKNITFVYITNHTSQEDTWRNLISNIKGEHYRVSENEWNYLTSKFNITGIPHYVLVGKNGEILNPNLGHMDSLKLKTELDIYLKEKSDN